MAKSKAFGADAAILLAEETTEGTSPSGPGVYTRMPFLSGGVSLIKNMAESDVMNIGSADRDDGAVHFESPTVSGNIVVPLDYEYCGLWFNLIMGQVNTAGAGDPYTHTFKSGAEPLPFSIEVGHPQLTTPEFFVYNGCKAGGFSLSLSKNGAANMNIPILGRAEAAAATSKDTSPLTKTWTQFFMTQAAVKVGGTLLGNVTGASLDFTNNIEAVESVRNDGVAVDSVDAGRTACTGSVNIRWGTDTTLDTPGEDETPVAMQFEFVDSANRKLEILLPRTFLGIPTKEIPGPAGIERSYNFMTERDTAEACRTKVTLVNAVVSY